MGFRYGFITDFDAAKGQVRVQFEEDNIVSDWLPVIVPFAKADKMSLPITINEQVCCLMDADCEDGVCLGAVMNDDDKPYSGASKNKLGIKFSDGTLVEYDKGAHKLSVTAGVGSSVEVAAVNIKLTGIVTITGAMKVTGVATLAGGISSGTPGAPVQADGDFKINGALEITGDAKIAGKQFATHKHTGVTTGAGTSGPVSPI